MHRFLRRIGTVLLSALVVLVVFGQVAAQTEPVPVDAYWEQVAQTRENLLNMPGADPQTQQARLEAEARQWESITAVELEDGTVVPVDHSYLVARLRAEPPDVESVSQLLGELLTQHQNRQTVSSPANADASKVLDDILASPEFDWGQEEAQLTPFQEWLESIRERIREALREILPESVIISGGSLLDSVLIALGVVVMVIVLFYAVRSLLTDLVTEAELEPDEEHAVEILTSETAMKRAHNLSKGGDYRTAVRYLYLSSLLLLEERGLLQYDRSRTNREYLKMVAQHPRLSTTLRDVVDVFDRVWYGYHEVSEDSYSQYEERVTELRQQK